MTNSLVDRSWSDEADDEFVVLDLDDDLDDEDDDDLDDDDWDDENDDDEDDLDAEDGDEDVAALDARFLTDRLGR